MRFFIFIFILFFQIKLKAQIDDSLRGVVETKVEIEAIQFLSTLDKDINLRERQFAYDTFKVERALYYYMESDYSTAGSIQAAGEAHNNYDLLLNKYYKLVLKYVKNQDRTILITAQKSWLRFQIEEEKLIDLFTQDRYTGGGSMYLISNVFSKLEILKRRVIDLFLYYDELKTEN